MLKGVEDILIDPAVRRHTEAKTTLAAFPFLPDAAISPIIGGRRAALAVLARVDPQRYTRSRNYLNGAVTQLSPYLRHGVLTLAEVRDHVLRSVPQRADAEKLVNELAWRDYWQRLYYALSEGIWQDREPLKTGFTAGAYADQLPEALHRGTTGLNCMDSFSRQLQETGWLHNHARMWMAAYLVHWLRVRWQAGAAWFLQHLLDGDPASNNLSWQWISSNFSNKPYIFNRENLERYTDGAFCRTCALRDGGCPFQATYEDLEVELFRKAGFTDMPAAPANLRDDRKPAASSAAVSKPLLWVHTDALNPEWQLFGQYSNAPACFVWDEAWLRESRISSKRVLFLEECLSEMPARLERRKGEVAAEVVASAEAAGASAIIAQRTPDPRLLAAAARIAKTLPVLWVDPPRFVDDSRPYDLKRFSRFWQKAQSSAMRETSSTGRQMV